MNHPIHSAPKRESTGAYLPDFCSPRMAFAAVLIAELVALLLALARPDAQLGFWSELASASLILLWIALGTAGLLCLCRNWLNSLPLVRGSALALLIIVLVPLAISEVGIPGRSVSQ